MKGLDHRIIKPYVLLTTEIPFFREVGKLLIKEKITDIELRLWDLGGLAIYDPNDLDWNLWIFNFPQKSGIFRCSFDLVPPASNPQTVVYEVKKAEELFELIQAHLRHKLNNVCPGIKVCHIYREGI